jgi:hypothetical protein
MRQHHAPKDDEPVYALPLSQRDVRRARARLAYEMLELV